jgi:hypothetical protein
MLLLHFATQTKSASLIAVGKWARKQNKAKKEKQRESVLVGSLIG